MISAIPPYVYREKVSGHSLLQGDILKVDGQFREHFVKFYPEIALPDDEERYAMILTQSCDLVRDGKRKPKLTHINVCLVRSLKTLLERLINEEIKPLSIADTNLLTRDALDQLKDKLSKLLNNSDQKTHFFLPQKAPFTEDMIAILPLSFSFRMMHYDLLLQNRALGLKPEFQAKIGYIISQLYGRIGTDDLSDSGWDDRMIRDYINNFLNDFNLIQVPDKNYIEYIKNNSNGNSSNIKELEEEYAATVLEKQFSPVKNEIKQNLKKHLCKLFEDK